MDGVERSRRRTETDFEQVAESLSLIETYVDQLRTLAHPEALRTDVREQRFIAHTLQIAIQAAADVSVQVAAALGLIGLGRHFEKFGLLSETGWISPRLSARLRDLVGIRNNLAHNRAVDSDLLANTLLSAPEILQELVQTIRLGFQPLASISSLATALGQLGFGQVDPMIVAATLLSIRGKGPEQGRRQVDSLDLEALPLARSALQRAIGFLRDTAQFPHVDLLPSEEIFVVLALFFHQHPTPSPRTKQLLSRWVWRTAVTGAVLPLSLPRGDESELVQRLLTEVHKPASRSLDLRRFSLDSAQTKLQFAALAALHPRHLVTGEVLDIATLCEQPAGPAMPLSSSHAGLADHILHPPAGDVPLLDLLARCDRGDVLRSHGVSLEARGRLRRGDLAGFRSQRESDLQRYLDSFLESRVQWDAGDRDRPALASLIVADE